VAVEVPPLPDLRHVGVAAGHEVGGPDVAVVRRGPGGRAAVGAVVGSGAGAVNRHQRTALDRHCRLAVETMHPRFGWVLPNGLSVVLTVNSGYE
jgi:hypothetical protein